MGDLIVVDDVITARVKARCHDGAVGLEMLGGLQDALGRDERVRLAAAEEGGGAVERATFVAQRIRTDEATGETQYAGIAARIACGIFKDETGALRETGQRDLAGCVETQLLNCTQNGSEPFERLAEIGL